MLELFRVHESVSGFFVLDVVKKRVFITVLAPSRSHPAGASEGGGGTVLLF